MFGMLQDVRFESMEMIFENEISQGILEKILENDKNGRGLNFFWIDIYFPKCLILGFTPYKN